jgi:hypothetical protein
MGNTLILENSTAVGGPLATGEGAVAASAERGARKGGDDMNAKTLNAPQLRKMLVALASVVLLAASGLVYSAAAGSGDVQLACNAPPACGG